MLRHIIDSLCLVFVAPMRHNIVPVVAAGIAVAGASAYMGFKGSAKAEKAAQDAAEYQAAIAKQQYKLQKENIAAAKDQAQHKASMDMHDSTVAFMKQRATAMAGAGEAGVAGGSVTRTIVDTVHQQQDVRGRHMYALETYLAQADRDLRGAAIGYASQAKPYEGTSNTQLALQSGLNFASSALSIYGTWGAGGGGTTAARSPQ